MAFITVEDLYGSIECVAFPRIYERCKQALRPDTVVRISGKLDLPADKAPTVILDFVEELPEEAAPAPVEEKREEVLWIDARDLPGEDFEELLDVVAGYTGKTRTKVLHGGKRYEFFVNPNRALFAELRTFLAEDRLKLV